MEKYAYPISTANIAALQGVVDEARTSGQIEPTALRSMAETVLREFRMGRCEAYLASKDILPIEREAAENLKLLRNDERALDIIALPYRLGDIQQIADVLGKLDDLSKAEERLLDTADSIGQLIYHGTSARDVLKRLHAVLRVRGMSVDLVTRRIEPPRNPFKTAGKTLADRLAELS